MRNLIICILTAFSPSTAFAHDTWVEANTSLVRLGEIVHVDLKLGNHGNDHRDFKLASKVSLGTCQIAITEPGGASIDLKPQMIDVGYSPKEGYWTTRYSTKEPGLHLIANTAVSMHGKTRSIKSAKASFMVSKKLDDVPTTKTGFEKTFGHPLEIVPLTNPVTEMGPGQPIRVQVLLDSKPLDDAKVSFIPRGIVLEEGFDKRFERKTDAEGVAIFTPQEGNILLIAVHHSAPEQKGDGYDGTTYSATFTVIVPQLCPDCVKAITPK